MKGESNSSSHATMLIRKTIEGFDSLLITDEHGNLPTFLSEFCLTLRACLRRIVEFHAEYSPRKSIASATGNHFEIGATVLPPFFEYVTRSTRIIPFLTLVPMDLSLLRLRQASVASRIWKITGLSLFIPYLQSGRIPAMCLYYSVTSYASTGIYA